MTDPERVARFWLVLAVASLWVVSVGSVAEDQQDNAPRSHLELLPATHVARRRTERGGQPAPRQLSCFRRGLFTIVQRLIAGRAVPLGRFRPTPWPTRLAASAVSAVSAVSAAMGTAMPPTRRQKTYP